LKIVSWHPVLTDHQSYTLEALRQAAACDLKIFVADKEHSDRKTQGWTNPHALSMPTTLIPRKSWHSFVFQQLSQNRNAVHFFGSPFEQPRMIITLLMALFMGIKVYLISEPYSPISVGYQDDRHRWVDWIKGKLRPVVYRIYGIILCRRVAGVFAISPLAVTQYRRLGIPRKKIFPFGYFVPYSDADCSIIATSENHRGACFNLVFVGTLISRKGLDVLIRAVRNLLAEGAAISLDVYGSGDTSLYDFDSSSIRYLGAIPFGCAQAVIENYDLFVLPSRYDGWGVVVNEALMVGVPVVCSSAVGAAAMVKKWACGSVFESENVSELELSISAVATNPELLAGMRANAKRAAASLQPSVAGGYMAAAIASHSDDITYGCPWYEC